MTFLRRRVAKAIPEINANKSEHFISVARNRFNLLLLKLASFFFSPSNILLTFSTVYQMLDKYSVLVLAQHLCVQDQGRK